MARTLNLILGIGFLIVGVAGFVAPSLLGMHLSPAHSIIHLVSGALAVWFGTSRVSLGAAKSFAITFGFVYGLLGVAGFLLGQPGTAHVGPDDARMWALIPGQLELGTMDHIVHIVLGAAFLIGGLMTKGERAREPYAR